jgi:hypothetical protein
MCLETKICMMNRPGKSCRQCGIVGFPGTGLLVVLEPKDGRDVDEAKMVIGSFDTGSMRFDTELPASQHPEG